MSRLITPEDRAAIDNVLAELTAVTLSLAGRGVRFDVHRDFSLWDAEHGRWFATLGINEKIEDERGINE